MTETVERCLRQTMRYHHLSKRTRRGHSVISIGSDAEVPVPDARIKYLRKGDKEPWKFSTGGQSREWDGVRLNGETYWVGELAEILSRLLIIQVDDGVLVNKCTRDGRRIIERGVIRRITETRRLAGKPAKEFMHVHWLKELAVGDTEELFLADVNCQDVSLTAVKGKLHFALISDGESRSVVFSGKTFCR